MSTKYKGVAIGAGYFSHFQYQAWDRIPEVEIVAVCNRSKEKGDAICEQYGIPHSYGWDELEKMIDTHQPDFVDIITSPVTHQDLCKLFSERGIAIICQKPLSTGYEAAKGVVEQVASTGVPLMIHENFRWQPWYREIKRLMNEGLIGDLHSMNMFMRMGDGWGEDAYLARQPFFRDYERLLVFETGVHFLDTFRYLGGEIESVYTRLQQRNPVIKGEDSGQIICGFASGATAILDANRYNEAESDNPRYTFGHFRVDGSKGHLRFDLEGNLFFKALGEEVRKLDFPPSREGIAGDCVYNIQRHFIDEMLGDKQFESTGEDYLKSMALVEACYQSNSTQQAIHL